MNTNTKSRPQLLSALCILTFAGSSFAFLGYFLASLNFEKSSELIIKYSSWHSVEAISPFYLTTLMALYALSLIAAIRIWKLHRDGFYLYVLVQIVINLLPVFWINAQAFSDTNAIFTTVFVVGYAMNWRWLS